MEIDELVGRELADAVCEARGLKLLGYRPTFSAYADPDYALRQIIVRCDEPLDPDFHPPGYRPDLNIAQAGELDGEGWLWDFRDHFSGLYLDAIVSHKGHIVGMARVVCADFSTKATAYATARCRAFLKAKAAQ